MTDKTIRPYGGWKFKTVLDSHVYECVVYCHPDQEVGNVWANGMWFGMMKGDSLDAFKDHDSYSDPLTRAERKKLVGTYGLIVSEDAMGHVSIDYFDTVGDLDEAWAPIYDEFNIVGDLTGKDEDFNV